MSTDHGTTTGPDLSLGIPFCDIPDGGMLAGQVGGKAVLLSRAGNEIYAIGALCTHYGASLADGLVVGETVRCPWHHACFSLRTGEALRAPALNPVARWEVERRGESVFVTRECPVADGATATGTRSASHTHPSSVVIVGGGAAGSAAAETLRRGGYTGPVTIVSGDAAAPYDRPNLSKDYLAGTASEDWIPLRAGDFYVDHEIRLLLGRQVIGIDAARREVALDDGGTLRYGALLLAIGADPVRLPDELHRGMPVHYLRTLADSRAIRAAAASATRVVVLGASFIGLEVAAALRARGLEVHVAGPEARPLERVLGSELGDFVRALHERNGVTFHLGQTAREIGADSVVLTDGSRITADFVVAGIGVRPNVSLAERAGLRTDRGIVVNRHLETTMPGVFAAGDIARWPDPHSGGLIRVEHWAVAQWQGQTAARNMLGDHETFDAVPFFWSRHYDASIQYVGHAERWDTTEIVGAVDAGDCTVTFKSAGRTVAVATVGRDRASLEAAVAIEGASKARQRSPTAALPSVDMATS